MPLLRRFALASVAIAFVPLACSEGTSGGAPVRTGPDAGADASSDASSSGGGSGAGGRTGTPDAGTDAAADSGAAPRTMTAACLSYTGAACRRFAACGRITDVEGCITSTSRDCPDRYFSEGSQRTIDGMFACVKGWEAMSCDELDQAELPSCSVPGTKRPGEPCLYSSQCDANACSAVGGSCGVCVERVPAGEACEPTDRARLCVLGSRCTTAADGGYRCAPSPPTERSRLGEPCRTRCADGSTCVVDSADGGSAATCRRLPGPGEACANAVDGRRGLCEPGTYCAAEGTCVTASAEGEPCVSTVNGLFCAPGLFCGPHADGGSACTPLLVAGSPCSATTDCAPALDCVCADGGDTCDARQCLEHRDPGATCGPTTYCRGGASCVEGTCAPMENLTRFDAACARG